MVIRGIQDTGKSCSSARPNPGAKTLPVVELSGCGFAVNIVDMKHKIAWFILLAALLLVVTACGDDDDDDSTSSGQDDDDTADDGTTDDDTIDDDTVDDDTTDDDTTDDDTTDDDTVDDDTGDDDTVVDDDTVTTDYESPLCEEWQANPEDLDDPVNLHCLIELGQFAPAPGPAPATIRVVSWNIERGHSLDDYIDQFQNDTTLSEADILLLQEVDRYCPRTDDRHVVRELAEALSMDYVYAVEFVEIAQDRGEHGNAVLSRFPILSTAQRRLTDFEKWYLDEGQPRLGGRIVIRADVQIGEQLVQLASAHLTSGVLLYFQAHQTQTQETLDFLADYSGPTIWGGDLNTGVYWVLRYEPSIKLIKDSGYADALAEQTHDQSWTYPPDPPIPAMRLDWIFYRDLDGEGGRVLYEEPLNGLSDHLGIYSDFAL